jgi:hypothetical protein
MQKKQIIGVLLVSLGIGALSYIYTAYVKPKKDALEEIGK